VTLLGSKGSDNTAVHEPRTSTKAEQNYDSSTSIDDMPEDIPFN
jgi:hypothetical protein